LEAIELIIISNGSMYLPMKLTIEGKYVCCADKRSKVAAAPNSGSYEYDGATDKHSG
jgi:hypothetical protein